LKESLCVARPAEALMSLSLLPLLKNWFQSMFWLQWSIQELTMHHTRILTTMWIWSMQEHSG
jgi:hypothetical protein